ncbi:gliding motility-associated C-terminal domain-containing protein [Flexithrix dorotheae]|uniref:T9SS type B sorting domain-containing protein n=1 Tax=Flexithrix dorotheae TaxID=70993 RepID=UPI000362156F|nr:gliding motility-associated C-terminal domain-containing protein [Flexithrix dorotheae]
MNFQAALKRFSPFIIILFAFSQPSIAQDIVFSELAKVNDFSGATFDFFGWSGDIEGDLMVVGSPGDQNSGNNKAGSVFIFQNFSGTWGQVKKLTAPTPSLNGQFGYAVGISGNLIVVGEYGFGGAKGQAHIFGKDVGGADNWGWIVTIQAADGVAGDWFGAKADIANGLVAIGAPGNGNPSNTGGAVYIFGQDEGGADNWGLIKKVVPTGLAQDDEFGVAVQLGGDQLLVGAGKQENGTTDSGGVYLFSKNQGGANNWGLVKKILPDDPSNAAFFGNSVAISDTLIAVGAPQYSNPSTKNGAVYLFSQNTGGAGNWGQLKKLVDSSPGDDALFGQSVAISGNLVIGGAYGKSSSTGEVLGFTKYAGGLNGFELVSRVEAGDKAINEQFGYTLAVSGASVMITSNQDNGGKGAAYNFSFPTASITSLSKLDPDPTEEGTVRWQIVFSEAITGLSTGNFEVEQSGLSGSQNITSVTGSGTTYEISVSTGTGVGSLALKMTDNTNLDKVIENLVFTGESYNANIVLNNDPTDIALSGNQVDEGVAVGAVVGNFSTTDTDGSDTHTYTLIAGTGDTDNASFTIVGTQLQTAEVFDFSTKNSYQIRVETNDGNGGTFQKAFTISVSEVNNIPTDISLSKDTISENLTSGTTIGTFSTSDADGSDSHTYTLVTGTGDTDNASFSISGTSLVSNAVFDYEVKSSYSIRVKTADGKGGEYEKAFTINIVDQEETVLQPPVIEVSANFEITLPENSLTIDASISDPDGSISTIAWSQISGPEATLINPTEEDLLLEGLSEGVYTFRIVVTDNDGESSEALVSLTVLAVQVTEINAPNLFSPNGDGIDDVWVIEEIENYQNFKLTIFNRSGQRVFEAMPYNNDWNASNAGTELPEGAYYYIFSSDQKTFTGGIRIVR